MSDAKKTMTLNLTEAEMRVLEDLAKEKGPDEDGGCPAGTPPVPDDRGPAEFGREANI